MKLQYLTKILLTAALAVFCWPTSSAQGWPSGYGGVMLQGFYWDSYSDTNWATLASQTDDMAGYIDLLWIPNAGNCGSGDQMGYSPKYWFPVGSNYNSSFGNLSQLRSLVSAMSAKGIGIIGDVVINHRANVSNWVDFPSETYNNTTYQLRSTDIVRDDDSGAALSWAQSNGYSLSSNNDTGDDWNGMRDLDHNSSNVQNNVKAYLRALLTDLGYVGFRYDLVAGFAPSFISTYNTYASPTYSVGECWKSGSEIKNWIDGTKVSGTPTSAAFDFQFRYTVRNAINQNNWAKLSDAADGYPLVSNNFNSGSYKRWAVTFVENHDTQYRDPNNPLDPIVADTLAANAYMLAMPGTPCVFLPHWKAYKTDIKAMVNARKAAGVTNTSSYSVVSSQSNRYVVTTTGTRAPLTAAIGSNISNYNGPSGSTLVASGYHYKYFMGNAANTAWIDRPSGSYEAFDVTLSAVTSSSGARVVYTTDGSQPTSSSTAVSSGSTVTIDRSMTLKAALLVGGSVVSGSTVTREYVITEKITVYLKDPGWSTVCFYGYNGGLNDSWPGENVTGNTKMVHGDKFYYREFDTSGFMVIFDNGNSGNNNQTVDIGPITADTYYEITGGGGSGKLTVTDVTAEYTSYTPEWTFGITGAGVFGGWDAANPLLFTPHDDGTYTLSISGATASQFKLSRLAYGSTFDGWDTFNGGAMGASPLAEGNNTLSTSYGEGNMNFPVNGDVTLTISNITSTTCTLNISVDQSVVVDPAFYLAGTVNNWSGADSNYKFSSNGNGVFTLTKTFSGDFKVVDENGNWWSTSSATTLTAASNSVTLSEGGTGNDMTLSASSEYTLTITVSGNTKTLTVTGFPNADVPSHTYVLRGTCNGWSGDADAFTYQGSGVYTLTKTFNGEFKVVQDGSTWLGGPDGFTFTARNNSTTLIDGSNMRVADEHEYTLTITESDNTKTLTVTGFPQAYYLVGAFNSWASEVPFTGNNGVFTLTQSLGGTGADGEFLVMDQYGQYLGGATDESVYTLHVGWHSVELATEAQGKKNLYIADAGNYTFTIENGVLDVTGWAGGVTLADALAGSTGVISDELTVVRVHGGKVYATDGDGGWVRLDGVSNADLMSPGDVIDSYQVSASVSLPRQAPSVAVNGALRSAGGDNLPTLRDIYLSKGYSIDNDIDNEVLYPTPGEVVKIRGFFFYLDNVPCIFAYSGSQGSRGMYLILDDYAHMAEGEPYAIDVAISLAEPWSAPSGARRRVSPSDSNAYTNLRGTVVGDPAITTGVVDVSVEREVAGVKYVSLDGRTGDRPFDGVNIVVTTYADGSVGTVKVLR